MKVKLGDNNNLEPDISVVIPVYNGADMLESCIRSVCAAGQRVAEIIVVDDGSTDKTPETADRIAEEMTGGDGDMIAESSAGISDRIQKKNSVAIKVIHTENHGCYAARRTGVMTSRMPYIAFMDVDDRFVNGSLDMLADLLEEHDADVAMGRLIETSDLEATEEDLRRSSAAHETEPVVRVSTSEEMWPRIMKWKTQEFVCYINKLFKRELLSELAEAEGINQGEDVLITCQAFLGVQKIVETTAPMYLYYINPDSLTHAGFGERDLDVIRVWDKVVEIMREKRAELPDLLYMAQYNRWRTDFTMITRLTLAGNKELDKEFSGHLTSWRKSLKVHWKDLIAPHAMPKSREVLIIGFRFFYTLTKAALRLGRKVTKREIGTILHSGDK